MKGGMCILDKAHSEGLETASVTGQQNQPGVPQIEVTPEMLEAGLDELAEHSYADDLRYTLECVYRAMRYASLSASPTRDSR